MAHLNIFANQAAYDAATIDKPAVSLIGQATLIYDVDPGNNGHAYVDLGLRSNGKKILFATMNIGASAPQEYGDYFAWGETSKKYTSISGTSINGGTFITSRAPFRNSGDSGWTKYNGDDSKTTLDAEDDVAYVQWGGNWRMPDKANLEFLLNSTYCTATWTSDYNSTGVSGFIFTGKGDYTSNSIFFPAAGAASNRSISHTGESGYYWSRSRYESGQDNAYCLAFLEGPRMVNGSSREQGYPVRPVLEIPA